MKPIIIQKFISMCVFTAIAFSQASFLLAQQNEAARTLYNWPDNANLGATTEARNAYSNATQAQKDEAVALIQELISGATQHEGTKPKSLDLTYTDDLGSTESMNAEASDTFLSGFTNEIAPPPCTACGPGTRDADSDGLNDKLEVGLADGFTPKYHVSAGEQSGTGFARFEDSVTQTVDPNKPIQQTPPISHYRVKPLGFFTRNADGQQYGLIQINYMTGWNRDDGLVPSAACVGTPLIDLTNLGSHNLDNEFSMILIAARVVNGSYDTVKANYQAYELFTAAHFNVSLFDQSVHYVLSTPSPIDSHINLWLSKQKHSTYAANPDYFPITSPYVIIGVLDGLALAYANGSISWIQYLVASSIAYDFFFGCAVDRFQEQGGLYSDANQRINVGEISNPMNGSRWIQDQHLSGQLNLFFY